MWRFELLLSKQDLRLRKKAKDFKKLCDKILKRHPIIVYNNIILSKTLSVVKKIKKLNILMESLDGHLLEWMN
jgi:hypothetical protein